MHYIDGFVVAVPDDQRDLYVHYAGEVARVFKEYGACAWSSPGSSGPTRPPATPAI